MNYVVHWDHTPDENKKVGLSVGDLAPPFGASLLAGGEYELTKKLGHTPVVLVFWASWCKPCLMEAPHLAKLYNEFSSKGVQFLAVSIDEEDDRDEVAKVVTDLKVPYPVALDPKGEALALYAQGASIPLTFVIGADGKVSYKHQNFAEGDERALKTALQRTVEVEASSE